MPYVIINVDKFPLAITNGIAVTQDVILSTAANVNEAVMKRSIKGQLPLIVKISDPIVKYNFAGKIKIEPEYLSVVNPNSLNIKSNRVNAIYENVKTALSSVKNIIKTASINNTKELTNLDVAINAFNNKRNKKISFGAAIEEYKEQSEAKLNEFINIYNASLEEAEELNIEYAKNAALMTAIKKVGKSNVD